MSGRQTEAVMRGLILIAAGEPLRVAAASVGVAPSTLTRAKKRAGMIQGKPGRRPRSNQGNKLEMTKYSYEMVTMTLREHIAQVTSVVRAYIRDGNRDEAWNLANSLWGAYRLWEKITSGDRQEREAAVLEQTIEDLLKEAE